MSRRTIQVFNMSFLDMITNFTGACILLLLLAMMEVRNAPCPQISRQFEANIDPETNALWTSPNSQEMTKQPLKTGDTVMVIITKSQAMPQAKQPAQSTPPRPYNRPPAPAPGQTAIVATTVTTSNCNNHGNSDPSDDSYTVTVTVDKFGSIAGSMWKEQGTARVGTYGTSVTIGPFRTADGKRMLNFTDLTQTTIATKAEVNPPICPATPNPPTSDPDGVKTRLTGNINFHLDWEDEADRVNLYVEKENRWVYGGVQSNASIGKFKQARAPGPLGKILNIEEVIQLNGAIPGTYKIYAHFKRTRSAKTMVRVRFIAFSRNKGDADRQIDVDVPLTRDNPRRGGGKLLATVQVLPDGTLKML